MGDKEIEWECGNCNEKGAVEYKGNETPLKIEQRVVDDHKLLSPDCQAKIRINPIEL